MDFSSVSEEKLNHLKTFLSIHINTSIVNGTVIESLSVETNLKFTENEMQSYKTQCIYYLNVKETVAIIKEYKTSNSSIYCSILTFVIYLYCWLMELTLFLITFWILIN